MNQYKLTDTSSVIRVSDRSVIPSDQTLIDWQEYQDWVKAGNYPDPYEPPSTSVPDSVTPHQAQIALLRAGLLDDVESAIDSIPDPIEKRIARIDWEKAQTIRRDWPLLVQLAGVIGITNEQLDALFVAAAEI